MYLYSQTLDTHCGVDVRDTSRIIDAMSVPHWAQRARARMKALGVTQESLVSALGVRTRGAVGHYLSGRRAPNPEQLIALARVLRCSVGYFFDEPVQDDDARADPVTPRAPTDRWQDVQREPKRRAQSASITPIGEPLNRAWLLEAMQNVSAIAAERGVTLSPRQYHTAVLWWYDDMVDERRDKPPRRDVKTILKLVGAE